LWLAEYGWQQGLIVLSPLGKYVTFGSNKIDKYLRKIGKAIVSG